MNQDRLYLSNIKKLKMIYTLMEALSIADKDTDYDFDKWTDVLGLKKEEAEKLFDEMQKKGVGV